MFVENLDDLPESLKDDFVEAEFDGKKGYQHKTTVALANSLKNAKAEKEELKNKFAEVETRLGEFERTKADEIESAKKRALESARTSKDVEAIEKRYQEQIADLEKRSNETVAEYKQRLEKVNATVKGKSVDALVNDLAEMATDKGRAAFKRLIKSRIDYDTETGKHIFLNDDGGATSLDLDGFKADIAKDSFFDSLLKADITTYGGGNAKGSGESGAFKGVKNQAAEEAKKKGDLSGYLKASINIKG